MMESLLLLTLAMPPSPFYEGVDERTADSLALSASSYVSSRTYCSSPNPQTEYPINCANCSLSSTLNGMTAKSFIVTECVSNKYRTMALALKRTTPLASLTTGCIGCDGASITPQDTTDADDRSSRLDLGFGVISLSAAMVATGLTASCLAAKTCRELVPVTRWAFDRGPVWGVVGRAGVSGLIHYAVARWIPKGKWRTATLFTLAAINVTNAVLDIRTLSKIERDAGR